MNLPLIFPCRVSSLYALAQIVIPLASIVIAVSYNANAQVVTTEAPPVILFNELDYSIPDLAEVKAAYDAGDMAAAKSTLLAYFRNRNDSYPKQSPNSECDTWLADKILKGTFIWGDPETTKHIKCSYGPDIADIQWYKVPRGVYWPLFDHELGRQTFLPILLNAYRNTGDEKYLSHLISMLLDFIEKCPVADGRQMPRINNADTMAARRIGIEGLENKGDPSMQWTQMVAMRRVQKWPDALQQCIHSKALTPDALSKILTSIIEHQRYLVDAMPLTSPGNHGTRTPTTVIEVAAKMPELRERDEWIERAFSELVRRYQWYDANHPYGFIYRDGATVEISPEATWGEYKSLVKAIFYLESLGHEIPEQFTEIREKMLEYLAYIMWPNKFATRRKRSQIAPRLPGRSDLDYILTGGTAGTVPKHSSYPLRSGDPCYAGTYLMRSEWSSDAVMLRVRFGPIQYKYSQFGLGDVGDIGVWGFGIHLVPHLYHHPRTGEYAAYGNRNFQGDGRSANTISVDGVGQNMANRETRAARPLDNTWITTPMYDYVCGSYQYDQKRVKARHTRAILFVKPEYFLVLDRIDSDQKKHHYRMKYQLHQDLLVTADGTKATGTKDGCPRIVVAPSRDDIKLSITKGQKEPYYEGWHLCAANKAVAAPALIYEWEALSTTNMETVIWPVEPGKADGLNVDRCVSDGAITITVKRGNQTDAITIKGDDNVKLLRMKGDRKLAECLIGQHATNSMK